MDTLLRGIVGSCAYGLSTPESDVDIMGVYLEPKDSFLGLRLVQDKDFTVHTTSDLRDQTFHEVGKFMRLALKSNPSILELLWLPDWAYEHLSVQGEYLIDNRHWFASADLVKNAYLGYATQQFKLLERRGDFGSDMKKRTEKHARHLYRLLIQGFGLYRSGELDVELSAMDAARVREFGQRVGAGELDLAKSELAYYERQFHEKQPHVRYEPNTQAANSLLLEFRNEGFK
jgi:predicted nucleotidyltransferase